jgi:hypothetical protein
MPSFEKLYNVNKCFAFSSTGELAAIERMVSTSSSNTADPKTGLLKERQSMTFQQ